MPRDYKDEYKKFQSGGKMIDYRAELNAENRKRGTYGNGDGKDLSHKEGGLVQEDQSVNRGRREKSRLKGSKRKKYQDGGLIKGESHDQGGVPAIVDGEKQVELEGNEFIISAESTEKIGADNLQGMNESPEDYIIVHKDEFSHGGLIEKNEVNRSTIDMVEFVNKHGDIPMSDARNRSKK